MEMILNLNIEMSFAAEEAYRVLRTNIQYSKFNRKNRIIVITSHSSEEGKTTTSINLGICMAKAGLKVLVVDADLRKAMPIKKLDANSFRGLSTYLSGHCDLYETIIATNIENMQFVPCGPKPPNPAELIESNEFDVFIKEMNDRYDVVIIDTPPLGSVIDAAIISSKSDGVIIVVRSKKTQYRNVHKTIEQLKKMDVRILGVVLNKVAKREYKRYYCNYDYYVRAKAEKRKRVSGEYEMSGVGD